MFSLLDLSSMLCSRDLDASRAQRIMGFLITHKSARSETMMTWYKLCLADFTGSRDQSKDDENLEKCHEEDHAQDGEGVAAACAWKRSSWWWRPFPLTERQRYNCDETSSWWYTNAKRSREAEKKFQAAHVETLRSTPDVRVKNIEPHRKTQQLR